MIQLILLEWKKHKNILFAVCGGMLFIPFYLSLVQFRGALDSLGTLTLPLFIFVINLLLFLLFLAHLRDYSHDINTYNGYLIFLLPYNGYQILMTKIIAVIAEFVLLLTFYGTALYFVSLRLLSQDPTFGGEFFQDTFLPLLKESPRYLLYLFTSALCFYTTLLTAMTLRRSLFSSLALKGVLSLLFVILLFVLIGLGLDPFLNLFPSPASSDITQEYIAQDSFFTILLGSFQEGSDNSKLLLGSLYYSLLFLIQFSFSGYLLDRKINL